MSPASILRSMIKPDGVQRNVVGNIIGRFEAKGYQLKVMQLHATYLLKDLDKFVRTELPSLLTSPACNTLMP